MWELSLIPSTCCAGQPEVRGMSLIELSYEYWPDRQEAKGLEVKAASKFGRHWKKNTEPSCQCIPRWRNSLFRTVAFLKKGLCRNTSNKEPCIRSNDTKLRRELQEMARSLRSSVLPRCMHPPRYWLPQIDIVSKYRINKLRSLQACLSSCNHPKIGRGWLDNVTLAHKKITGSTVAITRCANRCLAGLALDLPLLVHDVLRELSAVARGNQGGRHAVIVHAVLVSTRPVRFSPSAQSPEILGKSQEGQRAVPYEEFWALKARTEHYFATNGGTTCGFWLRYSMRKRLLLIFSSLSWSARGDDFASPTSIISVVLQFL